MSDPSLMAIVTTLTKLRGRIIKHPAFVRGFGSGPQDPKFHKQWDEIEDIRVGLLTAMQYLKSRSSHLDLREQVAFKLTREQRWRENQSIKDQRRTLNDVYQLSIDILQELSDLQDANSRPNIPNIMKDLVKDGSKLAKEAIEVMKVHGGHLDNVFITAKTMQNVPSILIIALIVAQLCVQRFNRRSQPD